MSKTGLVLTIMCFVLGLQAQENEETSSILFTNVKVFNGADEKLSNADVLVEGNIISQISEGIETKVGAQLSPLGKWFSSFEVLKNATADNAEFLEQSGLLHPFLEGW